MKQEPGTQPQPMSNGPATSTSHTDNAETEERPPGNPSSIKPPAPQHAGSSNGDAGGAHAGGQPACTACKELCQGWVSAADDSSVAEELKTLMVMLGAASAGEDDGRRMPVKLHVCARAHTHTHMHTHRCTHIDTFVSWLHEAAVLLSTCEHACCKKRAAASGDAVPDLSETALSRPRMVGSQESSQKLKTYLHQALVPNYLALVACLHRPECAPPA
eukprot:scaffold192711_cov21-Tisochrysis_lutea.AAC.1